RRPLPRQPHRRGRRGRVRLPPRRLGGHPPRRTRTLRRRPGQPAAPGLRPRRRLQADGGGGRARMPLRRRSLWRRPARARALRPPHPPRRRRPARRVPGPERGRVRAPRLARGRPRADPRRPLQQSPLGRGRRRRQPLRRRMDRRRPAHQAGAVLNTSAPSQPFLTPPPEFAMITHATPVVTDEHKRQYQEQGFFILPGVIPDEDLEMVRRHCAELIAEQDAEMDRLGTDTINLSRRNSRYFVSLAYKDRQELGAIIFNDLLTESCPATVG